MKERQMRPLIFPDSGETVYLPAVSMAVLAMKLKRKYKKPLPPLQEVDYGDGRKVKEFNYAHPEYGAAVRAWEAFINSEAGDMAYAQATDITLTEAQRAIVEEWKAANPGEWDASDKDKDIFLEEIAIQTDADFYALLDFVNTAGQPAEEVVKSIADGFPGNVQGQGHLELPNA